MISQWFMKGNVKLSQEEDHWWSDTLILGADLSRSIKLLIFLKFPLFLDETIKLSYIFLVFLSSFLKHF